MSLVIIIEITNMSFMRLIDTTLLKFKIQHQHLGVAFTTSRHYDHHMHNLMKITLNFL